MEKFNKNKYVKFVVLVYILISLVYIITNQAKSKDLNSITFGFPGTTFNDMSDTVTQSIYVQGTLVGADLEKMVSSEMLRDTTNNSVMISCYKQGMLCVYYTINQIGENQISDLPEPSTIPIVKWDNSVVVATDNGDDFSCTKTTINIDKKRKITEWVQEPFNQADIHCKDSSSVTYKWLVKEPLQ